MSAVNYALNNYKFPLGSIYFTTNAADTLNNADAMNALQRHEYGDWGECILEDRQSNDDALLYGDRLFSVYWDRNDVKFWIITEADRSSTTILLPEDY